MTKIVEFCHKHQIWLVHDFAYSDLCFDGYKAPSIMQVPGAKEIGVELFSMSKSYSMAGWRLGYCVGNPEMVHALTRIKSYLDYGVFQPVQISGIIALNLDDFKTSKALLSDISSELYETERFLAGEIDTKMELLAASGKLNKEIKDDLKEIDKSFIQFKHELRSNPHDTRLINAVLETYRVKIELLDNLLSNQNEISI